jgi:hypothetical protein
MRQASAALVLGILVTLPGSIRAQSAADWETPAEKSEYTTTPRYEATMAYLSSLAAAAPGQLRVETFGKTGEGRDLVLAVASKDGVFDPDAIHRAERPIVLVLNAIHAGEMDGKDSCLALLRDMVATKSRAALLDRAVVAVVPIYNADGHERFGPFNRINQNGPKESGWRTTAINLNLNRDFMKADAPETRAFLRLWNRWLPDYLVDDHVTDGADYQYDITLGVDSGPDSPPAILAWQSEVVLPFVLRSANAAGHVAGPLIGLKEAADPSKGVGLWPALPRYSIGYSILQNRPSMLVEMHMLKDYRTRVTGNYETLRALLEVINRDAGKLVRMNREADAATIAAGKASSRVAFPLLLESDGSTEPFRYRTYRTQSSKSEISAAKRLTYTKEPIEMTIPREVRFRVKKSVVPPAAYIVPTQWTELIDLLAAHGIAFVRTDRVWQGEVETERCEHPRWHPSPFEGRQVLFSPGEGTPESKAGLGECRTVRELVSFPAGSAVVVLDQRSAKVAIHLLEPSAPDSAVAWGFFNAIFEQKEFGEDYVVEKLATEMVGQDPDLIQEFEGALARDPKLAGSPAARLDFFFQRSPWRDPMLGLYPVGRLTSTDGLPISR